MPDKKSDHIKYQNISQIEYLSDRMSKNIPKDMSNKRLNKMSKDISEYISKNMSNKISKNIFFKY